MSQIPAPHDPTPEPRSAFLDAGRSATPKRNLRPLFIVGGILLLFPCICCGGFASLMGRNFYVAVTERDDIQQFIHRFMNHMESQEVPLAYSMFSTRARRQMPMSLIQDAVDGPLYALYADYDRVSVTFVNVTSSIHSDQNKPQGTVANVQGVVSYSDGIQGSFLATLEREGGQWRLHVINITVPPSKLKPNAN